MSCWAHVLNTTFGSHGWPISKQSYMSDVCDAVTCNCSGLMHQILVMYIHLVIDDLSLLPLIKVDVLVEFPSAGMLIFPSAGMLRHLA